MREGVHEAQVRRQGVVHVLVEEGGAVGSCGCRGEEVEGYAVGAGGWWWLVAWGVDGGVCRVEVRSKRVKVQARSEAGR